MSTKTQCQELSEKIVNLLHRASQPYSVRTAQTDNRKICTEQIRNLLTIYSLACTPFSTEILDQVMDHLEHCECCQEYMQ